MAINPKARVVANVTKQRALRPSSGTSVTIRGGQVGITISFEDGTTATTWLQFSKIGTAQQRKAVEDFIDACHIEGASRAGIS